jgi:putative endonuclease
MTIKNDPFSVKSPLKEKRCIETCFQKMFYTYILTNLKKTVLYTGVTNDLVRRIAEHYSYRGNKRSFAGRYNCYYLVYYEEYTLIRDAIAREKAIKNWPRLWKENLIARENPEWRFLNDTLFDCWPSALYYPPT